MSFPFFRLLTRKELAKLNDLQLRVYTAMVLAQAEETTRRAAGLMKDARALRAASHPPSGLFRGLLNRRRP